MLSKDFFLEFACGFISFEKFQNTILSIDNIAELCPYVPAWLEQELAALTWIDASEQLLLRERLRKFFEKDNAMNKLNSLCVESAFGTVKASVYESFKSTTLGDGITLSEGQAIDNQERESVQIKYRKRDLDIPWSKYPKERIESYTALSHLDRRGIIFYFPAYMCWCIENLVDDPYSLAGSQALSLFIPEIEEKYNWICCLSEDQKKTAIDFLWLIAIFCEFYRDDCLNYLKIHFDVEIESYKFMSGQVV